MNSLLKSLLIASLVTFTACSEDNASNDVPQTPDTPPSVDDPVDNPVDEPVDNPVDDPIDEPSDEPSDNPVDEPIDDPIDEPSDEPSDDPIDNPGDDPAQEPGDDPAQEPEILSCNDCPNLTAAGRSSIQYSECGAKGDGKTNDLNAIIATHECANKYKLKVIADEGFHYFITDMTKGATIKTNTDWTGAKFTIDDSKIPTNADDEKAHRNTNLFTVATSKKSQCLVGQASDCPNQLKAPKRHQENLGITLPAKSLVRIINNDKKQYIRKGKNQNDGSAQQDLLIVDVDGTVDAKTPIMWDYDKLTSATAIPLDTTTLTLKGGEFTNIANKSPNTSYYQRGIMIKRSKVVVDGLTHYVTGEGKQGAPYHGILSMDTCANITVKNSKFAGHKNYEGRGSYDIHPTRVAHLTFDNCKQTNDINDTSLWGVFGSNFCKDIVIKDCEFSRFDAHQGVANVTISGSKLGHQCLNIIGEGTLKIENSTLYGANFINLRSDYGSTWNGNVVVNNCTWIPKQGKSFDSANFINGNNDGKWDFGYDCYMPETITIDGLTVKDDKATSSYNGIYLFANMTKANTSASFKYQYPFFITKTVKISNFKSKKNKKWQRSPNTFMFQSVKIKEY